MRRASVIVWIATALISSFAGHGQAQEVMRIAAVVNDQVISVFDVQSRITMMLSAIGAPDTAETRREMAGPVLRSLIDESLQIQAAESEGIRMSDRELNDALNAIEQQNNLPVGGLDDFLRERGIPKAALSAQIRSQLVWTKFINQRLRPTIIVSEEDINEELARIEANAGKPEYRLAEIDLYVDDALREPEVRQQAEQLVEQIRNGARFSAIAQQFSQGSMAATGGDLGWVVEGQLRPEVARTVSEMEVGTISDPVRSIEGYHIIFLRESRQAAMPDDSDMRVRLVQVLLAVNAESGPDERAAQADLAKTISETVRGCADMSRVIDELGSDMSGEIGWLRMGDMPPNFRTAVTDLQVGFPAQPVETDAGLHVLMVCEREGEAEGLDRREEVLLRLQQTRLDLIARQRLRDLRRTAFVDIRV